MKLLPKEKTNFLSHLLLTSSYLFLILYSVSYGSNEPNELMEESAYAQFLDTAAGWTKANYESIVNWQGELRVQEDNYYYGEKCRELPIAEGDLGNDSDFIRRRATGFETFVIDIHNNKLYTEFVPTVKYRALDLNQEIVVDERYSRVKSVVTSDKYLSFEPLYMHAFEKLKNGNKITEHCAAAFQIPVEKARREQWSTVRDPRKYFFQGDKAVWEILYWLHNVVTGNMNSTLASYHNLSIEKEKTSNGTKFHIHNRIEPNEKDPIEVITTLDSSVGYNLISRRVLDGSGTTLQTLDLTYEPIKGIYLPKTVNFVSFTPSEQKIFDSRITFTKSILNLKKDSIPEETFTYKNLGLTNGDKFIDTINDKEYTYQEGELVPLDGEQQR